MNSKTSQAWKQALEDMESVLNRLGLDGDDHYGASLREIMHTAIKLHRDEADLGETRLISRSLKELRYALNVFRPYKRIRKVSIFGSARTPEEHPDYQTARGFAEAMARGGWMVITGAGDGIMRAGHHGAKRESSFGVSIRLPFETNANDVIKDDEKLITFRYFFTRKLMFMWTSHAVALFPGGFGTQDEGFEALTLIQTGKAPVVPIVCVDAPDGDYWKHWDNYVRNSLLNYQFISPEDLSLYYVTNDPQDAASHVKRFYRHYHSQRFVRDTLVLRLRQPINDQQLDQLNDRFAPHLVVDGKIQQGTALKQEHGELADMPRLFWHSNKKAYGHLRQMIDAINNFELD